MIKTKALSSATVLGMVAMLFAGCGDGDSTNNQVCEPNEAVCIGDSVVQVCNADGTSLVDFACGNGESCEDGSCVAECTQGDIECVSTSLSRVCSGDGWTPVPCAPGTACVEGEGCRPGAEGVEICTPNETVCANDRATKTCDADGAGWVYTPCAENETCNDGECGFDEGTTCTPRETACIDAQTAASCNDDGAGWTITDCPSTAPCTNGACPGPVCEIGDTRCEEPSLTNIYYGLEFRTLYTCVDGTNWEVTQCGAGEICSYDNITQGEIDEWVTDLQEWYGSRFNNQDVPFPSIDTSDSVASCKAPECDLPAQYYGQLDNLGYFSFRGEGRLDIAQCGNATDLSVDPSSAFSLCRGLPPFSNLTWSVTECPEPTTCTFRSTNGPEWSSFLPTCASECVPGEIQCSNIDSFQECGEDGTWGAPEECAVIPYGEADSYSGVCVPTGPGSTTGLVGGQCMDPSCAYWEYYGTPSGYGATIFGACTADGQFRACDEDGMLGEPEACEGYCNPYGFEVSNAADQIPGFCQPECADGQQRCINGNAIQTCVDGEWELELDICDAGLSCFFFYGENNISQYACGECTPGTSTCSGDNLGIVTCDDGVLSDVDECSYGTCIQNGDFAHCEAQCLEGETRCDTDGGTTYTTCEDGILVPETCETAGEYCRIDDAGKHYACVECLGPETAGNDFNLPDAYCNGSSQVVACTEDNTWDDPDPACNVDCVSNYEADAVPTGSSVYAYCSPNAPVVVDNL